MTEIGHRKTECSELLGIRLLMDSVNKGDLLPEEILSHSLICCQHEVLDQHVCLVTDVGKDLSDLALFIKQYLGLREVKIDSAALMTLLAKDL